MWGSWSTVLCSKRRPGCPTFLPAGDFPRPELSESPSGGFNSFGRVHFRPLLAALLPSIIVFPGIDIIHFAHRSWPAEILIKSVGGLWSSTVPIVVKYPKSKGSAQPRLCSGRLSPHQR